MTDLSHPAADADQQSSDDAASFLDALQQIAEILRDDLDHPEIWVALKDCAEQDDVPALLRLIRDLRPHQDDPQIVKTFDIVAAMVTGLAVDKNTGFAMFGDLEADHAHCPQVAGAHFFLERAFDPGRTADLSNRFCESPFIKFETLIDGTVAPCCSIWTQKRLGQLDAQSADEIWNGSGAQEMRASILDGSFRYCNKRRCTLINEDALPTRDAVSDPMLRTIIDTGETRVDAPPRWLFLAHDAACNLACPSCRDKLMGADEAQQNRFSKIEETVFHPLLAGEDEVTISVSGQGDPWSSPHYRSILRHLADNDLNVRLNIHTNGLLMTDARWRQYEGLARYRPVVDVSIDSCTPWVYEVLRRPGKWDRLETNLAFLGRERAQGTFREYHLNATIQFDNFHEMPALVDYAETVGADTVRLYMMQNTGAHISAWYASKNIGAASHPLHLAFLETLRDPRLARPTAHLYDVAALRTRALEMTLPTDALGPDYTLEVLVAAIRSAGQNGVYDRAAALCAGGRIRFPGDATLLRTEATAIAALGFPQIANYRLQEAGRIEGRHLAVAA